MSNFVIAILYKLRHPQEYDRMYRECRLKIIRTLQIKGFPDPSIAGMTDKIVCCHKMGDILDIPGLDAAVADLIKLDYVQIIQRYR